jgi:Tol biopolymer transport system component
MATGSPAWSPDSRKVVFDSRTKTPDGQIRADVYIVDIVERTPRKLITNTPGAFNPSWSHDGKWIYFVGGSNDAAGERIYRVSPEGGKSEVLTNARGYWPLESPDGQTLYFAENSGTSFTLHTASLIPTGTESSVDGVPQLSFLMNWDVVQVSKASVRLRNGADELDAPRVPSSRQGCGPTRIDSAIVDGSDSR